MNACKWALRSLLYRIIGQTAGSLFRATWPSFKYYEVTYVAGEEAECNHNSQKQTA